MKSKYLMMDVNIAYSMLNMRLRDKYSSLADLCEDEDIDIEELLKEMEKKGYVYNQETNQFLEK
ncbi:DUF4250 domain-containing protein [Fusobacterium mortiferum]|jgi:hypothetical protein|uniref:DUF4250 domain-containing protein n=1 Tax=Fusobacterium mortiferum TaxID=850 RepID=A0ABS2G3P0_FUSMR|nr:MULTISPECIES: DUF4250 domain-containing protein [Fusobacterium]MBM6690619.1 DUF4250 domain-containing protein [Fusobacterium mortiferum]MBM6823054.1 DUF4250 domain-containing protein [Fusobacterium mortiferum]MBM6876054.1 DUF4250 domain-containing protein [Fusobacterium mortiferum]MDO5788673.1 DUF4250 domain-containing protein [Fusobacterium sp.]